MAHFYIAGTEEPIDVQVQLSTLSHFTTTSSFPIPTPSLPCLDKGHVHCSPGPPRPQVEGAGRPQQRNAVGCVVSVKWHGGEEGLHSVRENEVLILLWLRVIHLVIQGVQTDRRTQTLRQTDRHRHTGRHRQSDRQGVQTDRQTDRQRHVIKYAD